MTQWLRAAVARMMYHGRVRLIEPYADQRLKLLQLQEARHFFRVPQSLFNTHVGPEGFGPEVITKPLGNPQIGQENIFYTRRVNSGDLFRP
jgi:hypothetical protein